MNYSLFKWSRKTCSGHDSNAAILQASREYGKNLNFRLLYLLKLKKHDIIERYG